MTILSHAVRWAARAVGAYSARMCGGSSRLIGGALSTLASCPHCDSAHIESATPRPYEQQSTWYRCHECGRIWSIPNPPIMPNNSRAS
jgi:predicted RNA-binding Zn-ribbon protein involved in translation (DUF1610 family)